MIFHPSTFTSYKGPEGGNGNRGRNLMRFLNLRAHANVNE